MSPRSLDFAHLSLRDALDLAVWIEEEARDRYEELADQLEKHHTVEAARFFRHMVGNEEKHRAALAQRRTRLFGDEPRTIDPTVFFDVEAPAYDEVRASMTPREALQTALRGEEKAWDFFTQALPRVRDGEVRNLFQELIGEELEHRQLVKKELGRLPPDAPFKARDFEDDPVAHD